MAIHEWTGEERGLRDAVAAGGDAAWQVLYDRAFAPLYAYVFYRVGKDRPRAEDVVQECWFVAVRRIAHFDPAQGSFEAWLRGIADKVLRNQWRRAARRGHVSLDEEAEGCWAVKQPRIEEAEMLAVTMAGLPEAHREVLQTKYAQGHTVAEIGEERGSSAKAVESLLSRARAAFREASLDASDKSHWLCSAWKAVKATIMTARLVSYGRRRFLPPMPHEYAQVPDDGMQKIGVLSFLGLFPHFLGHVFAHFLGPCRLEDVPSCYLE